MDAKKQGMTGGMMDDMMQHQDPQHLLNMIRQHEEMEIGLYRELAQNAPSMSLRQLYIHLAEEEARHVQMLDQVAAAYGLAPGHHYPGSHMDPPGTPPYFYTKEEKKEKK